MTMYLYDERMKERVIHNCPPVEEGQKFRVSRERRSEDEQKAWDIYVVRTVMRFCAVAVKV